MCDDHELEIEEGHAYCVLCGEDLTIECYPDYDAWAQDERIMQDAR